jgi:hypothetical protein
MTSTVQFGLGTSFGNESLVAAGVPVASPALVPSPVNIVRSSRTNADSPSHWEAGFTYLPEGIGEMAVDDMCGGFNRNMENNAPGAAATWQPYFLTAKFNCSAFGYEQNDYAGRARRLLEAATPKLLEWEFWGGVLSQAAGLSNTYLASITGAATATSIEQAIGELENALGKCAYGGRGMIHCPPYAAAFMTGNSVRREGNLLMTNRDTIVVPGSGYAEFYSGTGAFAMYATGLTDVRLGDIFIDDTIGIDKTTNTITVRAYRSACVSWDELCAAKVTVTLP